MVNERVWEGRELRLRSEHWEALRVLAAGEAVGHGWVGPRCGISAAVFRGLAGLGLCEMAPPEVLPTLGFGRQVGWAVRLTADGHDALLYEADRNAAPPQRPERPADPALRQVTLPSADMMVLRRYVTLWARLRCPPAEGLEQALRDAVQGAPGGRYEVWLTERQMASVARAFFLERVSGAGAPANRFGRECGAAHHRA
ncbi:hypothetical protein ACGFRG_00010 [Streptomyces sp. NPDC048696]|uniref:hypothetical protein n=1 Tax=Streptomyces sp. NPDC048696 TaxID=3365585 RepID=UPI0037242704